MYPSNRQWSPPSTTPYLPFESFLSQMPILTLPIPSENIGSILAAANDARSSVTTDNLNQAQNAVDSMEHALVKEATETLVERITSKPGIDVTFNGLSVALNNALIPSGEKDAALLKAKSVIDRYTPAIIDEYGNKLVSASPIPSIGSSAAIIAQPKVEALQIDARPEFKGFAKALPFVAIALFLFIMIR